MPDSTFAPRPRRIELPTRGGAVAALDMGPPDRAIDVVFSHANSFTAATYRSILAPAAERVRILAYDLRGHGASELPTTTEGRPPGWSDFGDDLVALLETLDLTDIVLAGHSMGATATLLAAAQVPHRARAVALFEPVIYAPPAIRETARIEGSVGRVVQGALRRRSNFPSLQAAMDTFVGRGAFATWPPALVGDFAEAALRPLADGSYELACSPAWEASNYATQPLDVWDAVRRAPRPMHILRGEAWSSAEITSVADELAASGVLIRTIPKTGHYLPMDRPDLVTETLRALEPRAG
jgi:pimeloyl-ACP methyl ester carboxylesterase